MVDAWILVRDIESNGERNRGMYIMKSRGMKHSNQVREFIITDNGLDLVDVYLGNDGVLIGSAREAQQLEALTDARLRKLASNRKDIEITRKETVLNAKIASLEEEFESLKDELNKVYVEEELKRSVIEENRLALVQKEMLKHLIMAKKVRQPKRPINGN